jgi:hypothetical protein
MNLTQECKEKCDLDANAVEEYKAPPPRPIQATSGSSKSDSKGKIAIWVIIALVAVLCCVFIAKSAKSA